MPFYKKKTGKMKVVNSYGDALEYFLMSLPTELHFHIIVVALANYLSSVLICNENNFSLIINPIPSLLLTCKRFNACVDAALKILLTDGNIETWNYS